MSKPWIHALSSVKRWGGEPEDYIEIHNLMDKSKGAIADSRHRALTHNSWFLSEILERIFGVVITNSAGREVSVRDVGEQHVLEDFNNRFIPSAQDYLAEMEFQGWMLNGRSGVPPSYERLANRKEDRASNRSEVEEKFGPLDPLEDIIHGLEESAPTTRAGIPYKDGYPLNEMVIDGATKWRHVD